MNIVTVSANREKKKLPLRLPWFRDPRKLNRTELLKAITEYGIKHEELAMEPKSILVTKLYALILDEGKREPLDPEVMNDQQPEKWYLLAERFRNELFVEISEGSDRPKAIAEANKILSGFSIDELIEVGNGDCFPLRCYGEVSLMLACRFVSAFTLEPHFEREADRQTGNGWIRSSVTIAGNYNGHTRIPHHLTLEGAQEENEKKKAKFLQKQKISSILTSDNLGEIRVDVGEEIMVPLTSTRKITATVTGVMDNDEKGEVRIIAVPTEIQELGPSYHFSLSINEYTEFRGDLSHLENVIIS